MGGTVNHTRLLRNLVRNGPGLWRFRAGAGSTTASGATEAPPRSDGQRTLLRPVTSDCAVS